MRRPRVIPTSGRTLGNADAKVTIDLWEDFQCTGCYAFTHGVEPQFVTNYVATGKVKVIYHDFIVIDANVGSTESFDAANAAMCANDQGKFWPYHDWLFANQYAERSGAFTKDRLKAIAHAMGGLDNAKFDSCVDGGTHNSDVTAEQKRTGRRQPDALGRGRRNRGLLTRLRDDRGRARQGSRCLAQPVAVARLSQRSPRTPRPPAPTPAAPAERARHRSSHPERRRPHRRRRSP